MHNSTREIGYTHLTKAEILEAKKVLAERNEKTRENDFEAQGCALKFKSYYHPASETGKQIYRGYSSEELLDILISYMEHQGHKPDWEKIHYVYKLYLSRRFGNLAEAKLKARVRQKQLIQQEKWPPDWPEFVSSEAFYQWLEERGKTYTEEDKTIVESICAHAKEHGMPPDLSSDVCKCLEKFGDIKRSLEKMNIPPLRKTELRFMARYWKENRTK